MHLKPGNLYQTKRTFYCSEEPEGESWAQEEWIIPQGIIVMFVRKGAEEECMCVSSTRYDPYYFLIGTTKMVFIKRSYDDLDEYFSEAT